MAFIILFLVCFTAQWNIITNEITRMEFSLQAGNPLGECITNFDSSTTLPLTTTASTTKTTSATTTATTTKTTIIINTSTTISATTATSTTTPATTAILTTTPSTSTSATTPATFTTTSATTTKPDTTTTLASSTNIPATTTTSASSTATPATTTKPASSVQRTCTAPFKTVQNWCYYVDNNKKYSALFDLYSACYEVNPKAYPIMVEKSDENLAVTTFMNANALATNTYYINHYYVSGEKTWHFLNSPNSADSVANFSAIPATPVMDPTRDWCVTIDNKGAWTFSECTKANQLMCELYP